MNVNQVFHSFYQSNSFGVVICSQGGVIIKLPNGYGTVYKLSGKRRKPYIARTTVGWDDKGKQIYKTIGYYATKQEGLQALADYNNNPYDLGMSKVTFEEMYKRWFKVSFGEDANRSTVKNYQAAYKHCLPLYKMKMSDIRLYHMQQVIDDCPSGYQTQSRIKILLNRLFRWCVQREYIRKNSAENLEIPKAKTQAERTAMTKEDITTLWSLSDKNPNIQLVLMLIYSGVRINELLNLKKEDVNLDEQWFKVRESKTSAGVRIVPIADKVLPFWQAFAQRSDCQYAVCTPTGEPMTYDNFRKNYWKPLMEKLNMKYTIHETRHTCNSLLIMSNCNPTIRKKIIGHKSQMDIGEAVYGHIYTEELLKAINKI
jgi:integrase